MLSKGKYYVCAVSISFSFGGPRVRVPITGIDLDPGVNQVRIRITGLSLKPLKHEYW
jgi:hypothetical protein